MYFKDQELISYRYSSCCCSCCGDRVQTKPKALSTLATIVAELGDYSRQCGQGLRLRRFKSDWDEIWQEYFSSKYASIDGVGCSI